MSGAPERAAAIHLVPGVGLELAGSPSALRFGMSLDEARQVMGSWATVSDAFVCGSPWALEVGVSGHVVTAFAAEDHRVRGIAVSQDAADGVCCPVVSLGVDLFGRPVTEVLDALRTAGAAVSERRHGDAQVGDLRLSPSAGATAGPGAPSPRRAVFSHACLHESE